MEKAPAASRITATRTALKFVVLLGIVSLFADMTYEGARSITGPYLAVLGASATTVGLITGLGELIGYGLRLVSGYLTDRTGQYWTITLVGYAVNMLAVPVLALAGRWELAAMLMIIERMGKAIRTPARDVMLSHATSEMGRGWGFGLHEAMDQIGAVLGPLIVAAVVYARGGYQQGFALLLVPALLALSVLVAARLLYPRPRDLEAVAPAVATAGLPRAFWIYLVAVGCIAAGFADFPLIAYHFEQRAVASATTIPILYAIAMGVDALAALVFGRLFDRAGLVIVAVVAVLGALFAPLVFFGSVAFAVVGMALWGVSMGAQESIMRAALATMVPTNRRGSAYGVFNTGYGLLWFFGSALMGVLYDRSILALVIFSVVAQLAAIPFLLAVRKTATA